MFLLLTVLCLDLVSVAFGLEAIILPGHHKQYVWTRDLSAGADGFARGLYYGSFGSRVYPQKEFEGLNWVFGRVAGGVSTRGSSSGQSLPTYTAYDCALHEPFGDRSEEGTNATVLSVPGTFAQWSPIALGGCRIDELRARVQQLTTDASELFKRLFSNDPSQYAIETVARVWYPDLEFDRLVVESLVSVQFASTDAALSLCIKLRNGPSVSGANTCESLSQGDALYFMEDSAASGMVHQRSTNAATVIRDATAALLGSVDLSQAAPSHPIEMALAAALVNQEQLQQSRGTGALEGSRNVQVLLAALGSLGQATARVGRKASDPGMHRRVRLDVQLQHSTARPGDSLLLSQHLDSSAYVDVDELRAMQRAACFDGVSHAGKFIDVEKPSYQSSQHWVVLERRLGESTVRAQDFAPGESNTGHGARAIDEDSEEGCASLPGIGAGVGAEMLCGCAWVTPSSQGENPGHDASTAAAFAMPLHFRYRMPRSASTCGPNGRLKATKGGVHVPHPLSGHPNAGHRYEGDWVSGLVGAQPECTVMAWADAPGIWVRRRVDSSQSRMDGGWAYSASGLSGGSEDMQKEWRLEWVPVENWADFRVFRAVDSSSSGSSGRSGESEAASSAWPTSASGLVVDVLGPMPVSADGGEDGLALISSVTWMVVICASVGAGVAMVVGSGGAIAGPPANPSFAEAAVARASSGVSRATGARGRRLVPDDGLGERFGSSSGQNGDSATRRRLSRRAE